MRKADVLKLKKGDLVRVTTGRGWDDTCAIVGEVVATDVVAYSTRGPLEATVNGVTMRGCRQGTPGTGVAVRELRSIYTYGGVGEWIETTSEVVRFRSNRELVSRWDDAAKAEFMASRDAVLREKREKARRDAKNRDARRAANRDAVAYLLGALPDGHPIRGTLVTHPEWRDRVDVSVVDLADMVRTITGE